MYTCRNYDLLPIPSAVSIGRIPRDSLMDEVATALNDSDRANSFMRLFTLFQSAGLYDIALEMHEKALGLRRFYRLQGPKHPSIRLLAIMGPRPEIDNSPIEYLVDATDVELILYYFDFDNPLSEPIPDHDVAMVSIGDSMLGAQLLKQLNGIAQYWPRPILNRPSEISKCARDHLASLFVNVSGLLVSNNRRVGRDDLLDLSFPYLVRPIESHAGKGFETIENITMLQLYLEEWLDLEFYVSDFINYQSSDGSYRKYRIALIDKQPYLCHLAVSDHWMVHYMSAGMELSAEKRAEEEAAFIAFSSKFSQRHRLALSAIADRLGLDYVVLDCAEMSDGRLVLFEADSRGWVHSVDPPDIFPYKAMHMKKVFEAFQTLVIDKSRSGS